jgi:hypothetical protein
MLQKTSTGNSFGIQQILFALAVALLLLGCASKQAEQPVIKPYCYSNISSLNMSCCILDEKVDCFRVGCEKSFGGFPEGCIRVFVEENSTAICCEQSGGIACLPQEAALCEK